jgi:hypothetical protein
LEPARQARFAPDVKVLDVYDTEAKLARRSETGAPAGASAVNSGAAVALEQLGLLKLGDLRPPGRTIEPDAQRHRVYVKGFERHERLGRTWRRELAS